MSESLPITNINDPRWVRAISHPLRIRLLAMLDEQAASPVLLASALNQPLGTVAYHVRVLYDLGLVELVSTRQRRGATEHYYRTTAHPRFTDEAWDALDPVAKQRVLTAVLSKAHDYATRAAAGGGFDPADAHFTSTPLKLDAQAWGELAKATKAWLQATARIEKDAARRLARDPHSQLNVGLVILLFQAVPYSADFAAPDEQPDRATNKPKAARTRRRTQTTRR